MADDRREQRAATGEGHEPERAAAAQALAQSDAGRRLRQRPGQGREREQRREEGEVDVRQVEPDESRHRERHVALPVAARAALPDLGRERRESEHQRRGGEGVRMADLRPAWIAEGEKVGAERRRGGRESEAAREERVGGEEGRRDERHFEQRESERRRSAEQPPGRIERQEAEERLGQAGDVRLREEDRRIPEAAADGVAGDAAVGVLDHEVQVAGIDRHPLDGAQPGGERAGEERDQAGGEQQDRGEVAAERFHRRFSSRRRRQLAGLPPRACGSRRKRSTRAVPPPPGRHSIRTQQSSRAG